MALERDDDPLGHLVDRPETVDHHDEPAGSVDIDQRCSLLLVERETATDDVLGVVAAPLLERALEQAPHDLVGIGRQLHDGVEAVVVSGEDPVKLVDLLRSARVAVEQEARRRVRLLQTVVDNRVGELVRHIAAGVEVGLRLEPELGLVCDVGAEDVPGGDRRHLEDLAQPSGLGPLACTGRADQQETEADRVRRHRRSPS